MGRFIDITGMKSSRLTVINMVGRNKYNHILWKCLCECGKETNVTSGIFRSGGKKSCGCLNMDVLKTAKKHGLARKGNEAMEYNCWESMKQRCTNKNNDRYEKYGGRGITICDRWLNSFENFLSDMGNRPSRKHSIDRINNDGNYEKSNCRWATKVEQARNQGMRSNNTSGFKGVTKRNLKWCAGIYVNGKKNHLGYFIKLKDAIKARKKAEKKYYKKNGNDCKSGECG